MQHRKRIIASNTQLSYKCAYCKLRTYHTEKHNLHHQAEWLAPDQSGALHATVVKKHEPVSSVRVLETSTKHVSLVQKFRYVHK